MSQKNNKRGRPQKMEPLCKDGIQYSESVSREIRNMWARQKQNWRSKRTPSGRY